MNVRKSALRAMNRCLSVAILLGAVLILASAQGGTFHCPVRAILFQFHLFLPRPAGGRSSRWVSPSEVFPRFSRQTRVRLEKMEPGRVLRFLYPIPHTVPCGVLACPGSSVSPKAPSPPFSQGAPRTMRVHSWHSRGLKSLISDKNSYVHHVAS